MCKAWPAPQAGVACRDEEASVHAGKHGASLCDVADGARDADDAISPLSSRAMDMRPPARRSSTRLLAGVEVPDSALVSRAIDFARTHSQPWLFNHAMRSWLFAATLARMDGIEHDAEVLAVTTLLHDLGLTESFQGVLRFEVEGANAARDFARGHGMDERRSQLVWDGVALNSTPSICLHKEAEPALGVLGVGLDWGGWGFERIAPDTMAGILVAYPRLSMKREFSDAVCTLCATRAGTTHDNFASDFGRRFVPGYQAPSSVDALMGAPFEE